MCLGVPPGSRACQDLKPFVASLAGSLPAIKSREARQTHDHRREGTAGDLRAGAQGTYFSLSSSGRERLSYHRGVIVPFGGNDWLALTQEPTLEPEMPICDPHHHFWDFRTTRIPYQRYLLHELAADIHGGHNVRSTVFIEARAMYRADGPEEMRPVGEVEFVQGLAAASASGLYGPGRAAAARSEEHTSELQSRFDLVCRLLLEKKNTPQIT